MNKQDALICCAVGVICVLIGVLLGVGASMIPENKCIQNPLYYGISNMETNTLKVTCYCNTNNPLYSGFFFNKTGVFPLNAGN